MGGGYAFDDDDALRAVMPRTYRSISVILVALVALLVPGTAANAHTLDDVSRERSHVEERAKSVKGTRYSYGGSSPRSGFDCSGFLLWVFKDHGAALPHSSIDQFHLAGENGARRVWKARNLERGDLVFFKTTSRRVGHAGMYLSDGRFIHSSSAYGSVTISSMSSGYYQERFVGATRLRVTR